MQRLSTVERAFELARSGPCDSVGQIRLQLRRERHDAVDSHLSGSAIRRQLNGFLLGKRNARAGDVPS